MFTLNLNHIGAMLLLFVASLVIAFATPPLTSQAATTMDSQQRAQLLNEWQRQVAAWQEASATSASATSGAMLGAQVSALPETGFVTDYSDPLAVNLMKATILSLLFGAIIMFFRSRSWQSTLPASQS